MLCKYYWIVLYTVHVTAFCLGGPFFSGHGVVIRVSAVFVWLFLLSFVTLYVLALFCELNDDDDDDDVVTCSICCHGDVKVSLLSSTCCRWACLPEYDLRWTRYSTTVLLGRTAFHITSMPRPPPLSRTVGRLGISGIPDHIH